LFLATLDGFITGINSRAFVDQHETNRHLFDRPAVVLAQGPPPPAFVFHARDGTGHGEPFTGFR